MKKIAIFCSVLALVGLASCDDKSDLGVQQRNAQENVLSAGGVTVTPQAPFNGATIDLSTMPQSEVLNVLTYTMKDALPAGAHMEFTMEVGSDANYSKSVTLNLTRGANAKAPYSLTAGEFENAVFALYGKEPTDRVVYTRVAAYMVNGTVLSRIRENDEGAWFMGKSMTITPEDLKLSELKYYFVDSLNGMSLGSAPEMTHGDKHPYDDPVFSYVIDITATDVASSNVKWAIAPESAVSSNDAAKMWGVAPGANPAAMSGELVEGGAPFEFTAPGKFQVRVDVQKMTYEIGFANEQLYVWTPQGQFKAPFGLVTNNYVNYTGVAYISGVWKLTGATNMMSLQIGKTSEEGKMEFGKTTTPFAVPEAGANKLYCISCNLNEMSYDIVAAESLGVVGGNNNWGNGETPVADTKLVDAGGNHNVWKATVKFEDAGNLEFKIRANNEWNSDEHRSFDIGYDSAKATVGNKIPVAVGGSNLSVPEVGTYEITIDFSIGSVIGEPTPYYLTVTKL